MKQAKLLGENKDLAEEYSLNWVRNSVRETDKVAAYQNHVMDSGDLGKLMFMLVGPGRTFPEAPEKCPDGPHGMGWKFQFVGYFDPKENKLLDVQ